MCEDHPTIDIHRRAYTFEDFNTEFEASCVDLSMIGRVKTFIKNTLTKPGEFAKQCVLARFPFIDWLSEYNIRRDLLSDIMSGVMVGIFNIPQGMAYGLLCGIPAVYGLYTSFYPPIFYALFGTSRHISIGTFSVISLMSASTISQLATGYCKMSPEEPQQANSTMEDWFCKKGSNLCELDTGMAINVATALTFMVGIFQIILGILHVGFLSVYLSDQLVEGLTTGSAILVFTSQVGSIFGIPNLPKTGNPFDIIRFYGCFFMHIVQTNWITLVSSAVSITILAIVKTHIEPIWKQIFKLPLPIDILIVALGTTISYFIDLSGKYQVGIVDKIPNGLYSPRLYLPWSLVKDLIPDAVAIAIVSYTMSISLAKLFAKKHDYRLVPNQEWFALGLVSIISSVLGCHPVCASLSRSLLQESQGGVTQVAGVAGGLVVLLFLLFLAPYLQCLPKCILAAIIVVALKGMFKQILNVPFIWRSSKSDFLIWIVSFLSVVFLDVSLGLAVSLIFALLTIIFKSQWPDSVCLGQLGNTEIYRGLNAFKKARELEGIRIYRFESPLFFANVEMFKEGIRECTGIDPIVRMTALQKLKAVKHASDANSNADNSRTIGLATNARAQEFPLHSIIIDCSSFPYTDLMGAEAMKQVYMEYKSIGITVMFAACKVSVRQLLKRADIMTVIPSDCFHPSVIDSVAYAQHRAKDREIPAAQARANDHEILTTKL